MAYAVLVSAVPLPVFSPLAFVLSVAEAAVPALRQQEAVVLTSSLQEETSAAAAAGARSAKSFAAAQLVGSGSARADWVEDERFRDDCSVVPQADDLSPVGYSADSSRDDCLVALLADDLMANDRSLPAAALDGSPQADCSADSADYSRALSVDDSCSAPVDSALPLAHDLSPDDCLAVTATVDSAALLADDSVARD